MNPVFDHIEQNMIAPAEAAMPKVSNLKAIEWSCHAKTTVAFVEDGEIVPVAECSGFGRPSSEDEKYAASIVLRCNAHDDLVKQLKALLGYADAMHRADAHEDGRTIDYETFPEARAALAKAGEQA